MFASDGILESENAEQQEFGLELLSAVLQSVSPEESASEICDLVLDAANDYSGGGAPADDRTLLVLRVTDHTSSDFSKLPIIY
jgi:serine phosphatase RsbU (regulator of sigma subunit)